MRAPACDALPAAPACAHRLFRLGCFAQVEKELEEFGDIVFVREKTNYKSILYKTYFVRAGAFLAGCWSRAACLLLAWRWLG